MDHAVNRFKIVTMFLAAAVLLSLAVTFALAQAKTATKAPNQSAAQTSAPASPTSPTSPPASTRTAATTPALRTLPEGMQLRGLSIQLASGGEGYPYESLIHDIAKTGANCVKLVVAAYQENCSAVKMAVDPNRSPSDKKLKALVQAAHKDGMKVILMPIVLLNNPGESEWRGKIEPKEEDGGWDAWWAGYDKYILRYARLAQDAGVDMLIVGSELISTETQTSRWEALIADVRKVYQGLTSYSANWDHYRPVKFWGSLDVVGMTSYYDLVGEDQPTREKLLESWSKIRQEILEWQATIHRPIVFTEVGWPNQATAAKYPWDYYRSMDKPDPQQQKLCFDTFFETFGKLPQVAGVLVWEWCNNPSQVTGPDKDTGYCPKDKPAMDVIKAFFKNGGKQ